MSLSKAMWKITEEYTSKLAYILVRQPASRSVRESTIGPTVQLGLDQLALQFGWREENIRLVDENQGRCGSNTEGRGGYEQMLNDVAGGRVGAIFCLELSRLGWDITDWHDLIKTCQQTDTLVIDTLGIYDARDANENMMLMFNVLIPEVERKRVADRLRGAKGC